MRSGCSGCLVTGAGIVLGALLLGGAVGLTVRMLTLSNGGEPAASATDGKRAQQKLFALARAGRGAEPVTLTEAEVNGLLARHVVEAGGTRLDGLTARLVGEDRLELRARTPLGHALAEVGLGTLAALLPASWQTRPVRLTVRARLTVEDNASRYIRMDVNEFAVGGQRLPAPALRLLVDPTVVGLLRWRLPDHVERVRIEPGRVVIGTGS